MTSNSNDVSPQSLGASRTVSTEERKLYREAQTALAEIGITLNDGFTLEEALAPGSDGADPLLGLDAEFLELHCGKVLDCTDLEQEFSKEFQPVTRLKDAVIDLLWLYGGVVLDWEAALEGVQAGQGFPSGEQLSDDVAAIDHEAIEEDGSYIRLFESLSPLSQHLFTATPLKDHVPFEGDVAWLEIDVGGQTRRWDFRVDYDWADPKLFKYFDDLVAEHNPNYALWSIEDGQFELFFVKTKQEIQNLSKISGLKFSSWRRVSLAEF